MSAGQNRVWHRDDELPEKATISGAGFVRTFDQQTGSSTVGQATVTRVSDLAADNRIVADGETQTIRDGYSRVIVGYFRLGAGSNLLLGGVDAVMRII